MSSACSPIERPPRQPARRLPRRIGVTDADRQGVAADLGFSETVFVDDAVAGRYRIFTPAAELPFAGHPTVGTAWLLHHLGRGVATVHPPAGAVPTWTEGPLRWIRARAAWVHPIHVEQLPDAASVDALDAPPPRTGRTTRGHGSTRRRVSSAPATSFRRSASARTRRPAPRPSSWATSSAARSRSTRDAARSSTSVRVRTGRWMSAAAASSMRFVPTGARDNPAGVATERTERLTRSRPSCFPTSAVTDEAGASAVHRCSAQRRCQARRDRGPVRRWRAPRARRGRSAGRRTR